MIYLNNAGTTWPKPDAVNEAMKRFVERSPDQWLDVFQEGKRAVTSFFGILDPDRFLFTQSCSQSMAIAFSDFPWEEGDRLLISSMEHHALSRWYYLLQQTRGVKGTIISRSNDGPFDLDQLESELKKGARMVAMTMASNVTGEVLPFEEVIALSRKYGASCLLDGAQTSGLIPIDLAKLDPDFFVFAGHKGPFGPQGIGGLYISNRVSMICPSAACEVIPGKTKVSTFPKYCDTGSAPMMAIAGLTAGVQWLRAEGWESLLAKRENLVRKMREYLDATEGIEIVGSTSHGRYTNAVSIRSETASLDDLSKYLWEGCGIKGSLGFQCAPLAHEALQTHESGTLRFSVGPFTTQHNVETLIDGLQTVLTKKN